MPLDQGAPSCDMTRFVRRYVADDGTEYGIAVRAAYGIAQLGMAVDGTGLPRPPRNFRPRRLHIAVVDPQLRDNLKQNVLIRRHVVFNTIILSGGLPTELVDVDGTNWTITGYTGERMTSEF